MNKKLIGILLISIFLLSTLPAVSADDDRSYTIDLADIYLFIGSNGLLHVNETYFYSFDGQFNGVYRDIPLKDGESIENINVTAKGAYPDLKVTEDNGYKKLKIYLYSDEAKTQPIEDTSVAITITYDFLNVVKKYNDVGELHYKLWGEEWDEPVQKMNAHIQFNSSKGIEYWLNPYYVLANENWNGNTLNIQTDKLDSGEYVELRAIIPLDQFKNPVYANKINKDGYDKIHKVQEDYENSINLQNTLFAIVPVILLISLAIPVGIYFKYGREPETTYIGEYEREPPTKDVPFFVDAMFSKKSDVGKPTKNGFQATVMDLINRKYISLVQHENSSENVILKINDDKDLSSLKSYENDVINLLRKFEKDGEIDLKEMKSTLKNTSIAEDFNDKFKLILSDFEDLFVDPVFTKYFVEKGASYFKFYGVGLIVLSILVIILSSISTLPLSSFAFFGGIIFAIIAFIIIMLPNRIGGRWTDYGKETYDKWQNFSKYLKDFSLIKEHPPESVVVWNQYLVYATALGEADVVQKAMKELAPEYIDDNDLFYYHYYGGSVLLSSAMSTASASTASSDVGGVGGGSGGGGGGAF